MLFVLNLKMKVTLIQHTKKLTIDVRFNYLLYSQKRNYRTIEIVKRRSKIQVPVIPKITDQKASKLIFMIAIYSRIDL